MNYTYLNMSARVWLCQSKCPCIMLCIVWSLKFNIEKQFLNQLNLYHFRLMQNQFRQNKNKSSNTKWVKTNVNRQSLLELSFNWHTLDYYWIYSELTHWQFRLNLFKIKSKLFNLEAVVEPVLNLRSSRLNSEKNHKQL